MNGMKISDSRINTMGRIDWRDGVAHFIWPGSYVEVRFTGTTLSASVKVNCVWGSNALGLVVDGRVSKVPVKPENNGQEMTFLLADNLPAGEEHTCLLYKRLDCSYDYRVSGFETDGEFLQAAPLPERKLEFYGDSVTSGAAIECVDYVAHTDPCSNDSCYDNSWYSYAWQTARRLNAQVHLVSQGGIAVFNNTGYFHGPETIGMEDTWNRLCYFPEAGKFSKWDFARYVPDAVVFAIGQNDQHDAVTGENILTLHDPAYRAKWMAGYEKLVRNVAAQYPITTKIVCMTTVLMHDLAWDEAIGEVVAGLQAEGMAISQFLFTRNGAATPGHPRIPEHDEMAEELSAYLEKLL